MVPCMLSVIINYNADNWKTKGPKGGRVEVGEREGGRRRMREIPSLTVEIIRNYLLG